MKFLLFYSDLLSEARMMGNEKFDWVASNMGNWLFDELFANPDKIQSLPNMDQFSTWVSSKIKKTPTSTDLVDNLDLMETFLHRLDPKESSAFIKSVISTFPVILNKITRYGKPEVMGKRGRPMGSKNKPKPDMLGVDILKTVRPVQTITQIPQEPQPEVEPKRRGRPKQYDDDLTAIERSKFRREGPAMIQSLEAKAQSLDNEVTFIIQRIKKIMGDIEKRKKFFGIS